LRGELAKIIYEAGRKDIEYMFGNSMTSLDQTERGVNVTFRHGSPQTFDLVIGGRRPTLDHSPAGVR
jgi:2-polyprenyl-6-methoxyphenol hydroxylase-like FAD-dependent oxidoreductase